MLGRRAGELALLSLPWPRQCPGVLAAAAHLPHFRLVCSEGFF
uniref:Stomatin-like 1 n=1 Tax=Mus musculus TaxID=10090 RepID=A0A1L1STK3_MOUSE